MLSLIFDSTITTNIARAKSLEWLETNGLGGYSCSTILGANTRRYHGLYISAVVPPTERMIMLSKLDEAIIFANKRIDLGANFYPGTIHPQGYHYLTSFNRGVFPTWEYTANGISIRKSVSMIHGQDLVVIAYEVLRCPAPFVLELRPFVACRNHHALTRANNSMNHDAIFKNDVLVLKPYVGVPGLSILAPNAKFNHAPQWYYNYNYDVEMERGFEFTEDLFTYGTLDIELRTGMKINIVASTGHTGGIDGQSLVDAEKKRRLSICKSLPHRTDLTETLALAADQFVVNRGSAGRTIIAGYPWFTDWGRDTMIALPGLCLATGRYDDAKRILTEFCDAVSEGMIPNRFPDKAGPPEYNTVDATLWFFVASFQYALATKDKSFVQDQLLPKLLDILDWHYKGTRYGIRADADGLLIAGDENTQLTWMDARVNGKPVTPRYGKAVEINALWYNAHEIVANLTKDKALAKKWKIKANEIKSSFEKLFWDEELEYLADCVIGTTKDTTLRPNQIYALSLPFPLLGDTRARAVLKIINQELYTPFGLRSLSPEHKDYRKEYSGSSESRDGAYHQGTVWSFLLGPYLLALARYGGSSGKSKAQAALSSFEPHLKEAGIGTVSEIFDADPPHRPNGCFAQAWGVGEMLRAAVELA